MLLLGHHSSHLLTTYVPDATCASCGATGTLQLSVFGRYARLLQIPLFAFGKTGRAECTHCQLALPAHELPAPLLSRFRELAERVYSPLWHSAGLLLIGALALGRPAGEAWQHYQQEQRLSHPQVGDLYHVRAEEPGYYTLMKVVEVSGNSLRLQQNAYETDVPEELPLIDKPANYDPEVLDMTQLDVLIMQRQDELLAIERPR